MKRAFFWPDQEFIERLLSRPPYMSLLGRDLKLSGIGECSGHGPATTAGAETAMHADEIHLRATLRSGRLHRKSPTIPFARRFTLLLDDSASVRTLVGDGGIAALKELFIGWTFRHRLEGRVLSSSDAAGTTTHAWGTALWERWLGDESLWNGGVSLVASDFHGDVPSGDFWMRLFARTEVMFLRLEHPSPSFYNGALVADCERPASAPAVYRWDSSRFERARKDWEQQIAIFLRRSNSRRSVLRDVTADRFIEACFRLLSEGSPVASGYPS